jgi:hypothetical protein
MIDLTTLVSEEVLKEFGHIGNDSNNLGGSVHALSFAANSPHVKATAGVAGLAHKASRKTLKHKKKKLKQRHLKEATEDSPQDRDWIEAFNTNQQKIKAAWTAKYGDKVPYPNQGNIASITTTVKTETTHSSGYKNLKNLVDKYFPLIELAGRFRDTRTKNKDKTNYDELVAEFITQLKEFNADDVLEFPIESQIGSNLRRQFSEKENTIGKFVLFPDFEKQSIWITVSSLLKRRQKFRSKQTQKIANTVQEMDLISKKLLVNYSTYLKGISQMPADFAKEFNDDTLPKDISLIGKLSFDYMQAEVTRLGYDFSKPKVKENDIFTAFLQNSTLQDVVEHFSKIVGRLLEAETTIPAQQAETAKIFNWDQFFEKKPTNESLFDGVLDDLLAEVKYSPETNSETIRVKPGKNGPTMSVERSPKGGYTIGNINNSKTFNNKAVPLIEALQTFANYISKEQKGDWKAAVNAVGDTLKAVSSMGGPNQGPLI